ncbi:MBL fold metallo-hydrolase [Microbaculum marinum]|uniref:MBL fold metallo-hydrolase n=1 Tax=Microbaculum marinum TaxID=1764581 RepID=A0AAW9RS83_9HYPH
MGLVVTILGCGSSGGVPRVASGWGACDPANPRNRRRRCSILVERSGPNGSTTVLVDTSPDLREQLIGASVSWLDGVLISHDHADHTHGIDDLRPIVIHNRRRVAVYMEPEAGERLKERFSYCFDAPPGSPYPPILDSHEMLPPTPVVIDGEGGAIVAEPIPVIHGPSAALGFRFADFAYTPDVSDIPEESIELLQDLDVWVVDALRESPHISHFTVDEALEWVGRIKPRRAILTNMHVDLDYEALRGRLPANVVPAYDGMRIELSDSGQP